MTSPPTRAWRAHPRAGLALRAGMVLGPLLASFAAALLLARLWRPPTSIPAKAAWALVVAAVAAGTLVVTQRLARRAAPLSFLLSMSLSLPDRIPSRFSVAMKASRLPRLADRAEADADPLVHVAAMATELQRHDRRTRGHSDRVRALALLIGEELDLSPADQERLGWAALLHDIGKLEVPAAILNSTTALTESERACIRGHPQAGIPYADALKAWMGDWVKGITEHHERYDGTGYPLGLRGSDISLAGRIVAVADAYETMTAVRSYKKAMSAAAARAELVGSAGTHFDPMVVHAFLRVSVGRMRWRSATAGGLAEIPLIGIFSGLLAGGSTTLAATGGIAVLAGTMAFGVAVAPPHGVTTKTPAATEVTAPTSPAATTPGPPAEPATTTVTAPPPPSPAATPAAPPPGLPPLPALPSPPTAPPLPNLGPTVNQLLQTVGRQVPVTLPGH